MDSLSDSPVARVHASGIRGASALDLVAVLLTREEADASSNEQAARDLIKRHRLSGLKDLSPADLQLASGLAGFEADRVLAAIEIGRRSAVVKADTSVFVGGSKDAAKHLKPLVDGQPQEVFAALFLSVKGHPISARTIHIGSLSSAQVGTRDVMREALRANAASVIVAHNHPSGDPTPSPADIGITRRLKDAGALLDIKVLDHLVFGNGEFTSLADNGSL